MREVLKFKFSSSNIEEITVPNELGAIVGNILKSGAKFAGIAALSALATNIWRNDTNRLSKDVSEYSSQASKLVKNMIKEYKQR